MPKRVTIDVRRHSLTAPNEDDSKRKLTPEGEKLARKVRRTNPGPYHLVLHSPVMRARDTARELTAAMVPSHWSPVDELYPRKGTPEGDPIWALFAELGNVPLPQYYAHQKGEVMREYGMRTWNAIKAAISKCERASWATDLNNLNVLIVGHAICLNAMGHAAVKYVGTGEDIVRRCDQLDEIFVECSGFRLTMENDVVTGFSLLSA